MCGSHVYEDLCVTSLCPLSPKEEPPITKKTRQPSKLMLARDMNGMAMVVKINKKADFCCSWVRDRDWSSKVA